MFPTGNVEYDEENRNISGYGVVFHSDSAPMYIWDDRHGIVEVIERITPQSMENTDMSDVISAYNHNFDKILGRTSSNTLRLDIDEKGIFYRVDAPDTTYANDLLVSVQRGDVKGASFVFSMDWEEGYEIKERADGKLEATPKKITKMHEIGPVVSPAYPATTAENRMGPLVDAVKRHMDARSADGNAPDALEEAVKDVLNQETPAPAEEAQEQRANAAGEVEMRRWRLLTKKRV